MKIRTSLTLWFTMLVGCVVIVSNLVVLLGIRIYLNNQKNEEAKDKANDVQKVIIALEKDHKDQKMPFKIEDPDLLSYTLSDQGTTLYEGSYLQVTDMKDKVFSKSPNLGDKFLPVLKTGTIGTLTLYLPVNGSFSNVRVLYYSAPLYLNKEVKASLQIGLPLTKNERLMNQMLIFEVFELILAMIVSILLGRFLSKRALSPMVKITQEVHSMAGQNLLKLLDTSTLNDDEIGRLAGTFNELLSRISKVFEAQQRFISDASHELRSPLTSIRGHAQLLLKRGKENPQILQEGTEIIIRESQRLERLVNDMLILAKSGQKISENKEFDIILLLKQLVSELQPLHNNLRFECLCDGEINVKGDFDELKRVFINLLHNAFRAVTDKDNGEVIVRCEKIKDKINICIIDNGIGIKEEHLEHVFERFYRVDSARERDKGGSGLGLSIVKEILQNHGGDVSVKSKINEGTTFIISLPVFIGRDRW